MLTNKYTQIERTFVNTIYDIWNTPYTLRRTIAAWPYFDCLRQLIKDLQPLENKEDQLFLNKLEQTINIFYTPHDRKYSASM